MTLIARVRTVLDGFEGGPGVITQYFGTALGSTFEGEISGLLVELNAAITEWKPMMPIAMSMQVLGEVDVLDDQDGVLDRTLTFHTDPIVGTSDSGFGPMATGLCVTWRTGGVVRGHHVRGRSFLVPCSEIASDDDGTPTADALAAAASYAAVLTGGSGTGHPMLVWSRPVREVASPHAIIHNGSSWPVASATITDQFAVLRSRRD